MSPGRMDSPDASSFPCAFSRLLHFAYVLGRNRGLVPS